MAPSTQKVATCITQPGVMPGEPRQGDDVVVVDRDGDVAHRPPAARRLPERLEALCRFANENHDGRTARALFYWYMLKAGYWPFEYISISALLKDAPIQYGEAYLFTESDANDLTYFVVYQLRIIQRAIDAFLEYVEAKRREYLELMDWLANIGIGRRLNHRQGMLLRQALKNPGVGFTAKEVKNLFDVSENTARADLRTLEELEVLVPHKAGKTVEFLARADASERLKRRLKTRRRGG